MRWYRGLKLRGAGLCALMGALVFPAGILLVNGQAAAADIYQGRGLKDVPVYSAPPIWRGFYVGGHIGGAWGDTDVKDHNDYNSKDPAANIKLNSTGFLGGAQIGYNFQSGRAVYGIEADIGGMDLSGSGSANMENTGIFPNYWLNSRYSVSTGLYGDITGRLGYAEGRNLFYMKGGAAFLNVETKAHYDGGHYYCQTPNGNCTPGYSPSQFDFGNSDTMWGWTIGAGVEHSLSPSWSIKAEYQHFDFGTMSYGYDKTDAWGQRRTSPQQACDTYCQTQMQATLTNGKATISPTADAVTVGLNYHLGR
jgi:outer membrane immunogenic protein